jgi:MoaA/NifB/PqqE/SkfB family radical SAM enzyme
MGRYKKSLPWAFKQFVNRIGQDVDYQFNTGALSKPSRIVFCLTLRCNIKCKQCGIWKSPHKNELTTDEWKSVMLNLKEFLGPYRLQIAGGEIFIRKDVVELVKFAHDNDILIGMVSNGTLINKETAKDLVAAGLNYFDISIDGIRGETHDYIRGVSGVYDKAMATVKYVNEYRKAMKSDLSMVAASIIMRPNMNELVDIVKWAEKEDLTGVLFNPLGPAHNDDPAWYKTSEIFPRPDELDKLDKVIDELVAMKQGGARILNSDAQLLECKSYFRNPAKTRGENCRVGSTNFLMSCDGEIHLCYHLPSIGNHKQSFREVWNSEKAKSAREKIKNCKHDCSPGNFLYRRGIIKEIQRYLQYR